MDPLLKQLKELPAKLAALPASTRMLLLGGLVVVVALVGVAVAVGGSGEGYQYAFTNLSPEDGTEAAGVLKGAGVPFRLEAGGAALAVPASKVYDARLLLASNGLPRGGGVGFELFDRGDLGVSEFTQKVNLRRALEGELARTIGRLSEVRSARVHLSLPEKGLYRDEDKKAAAAVVLNLQPGRALGERELAGVRHLVASSVPGLPPDAVTVMDGRGSVLSSESAFGEGAQSYQKKLESDLERRVVTLLEPVVGQGAVIARVTANLDASEVHSNSEVFDPDQVALRSERRLSNAQQQDAQSGGNVAGAAANQPLNPVGVPQAGVQNRSSTSGADETRNWEVSKTVTSSVARAPRLQRLSVAVLLDGLGGKSRTPEEVARLTELAKRAVGFDAERGDQIDVSSSPFVAHEEAPAAVPAPVVDLEAPQVRVALAAAGAVLLLLAALALRSRSREKTASAAAERAQAELAASTNPQPMLVPGATVGELEAVMEPPKPKPPEDPEKVLRERARALLQADVARSLMLMRAWLNPEPAPIGDDPTAHAAKPVEEEAANG